MTPTDLVQSTFASEIIAFRDAAIAKMAEATALIERGHRCAGEAQTLAGRAHGGTSFHLRQRDRSDAYSRIFAKFDATASGNVYREHLDASVWMHLLTKTGMTDLMDKTTRDKLYEDLCGDTVPPVTLDNIQATFEQLTADAGLIFQRGLARTFIELDRRFRSHDGFKIGSRIVLTNVFDGHGLWNWHSRMWENIADVERVLAVLDSEKPAGSSLHSQIDRDRGHGMTPRQSVTESTYFRIKTYKNGNAHLWFRSADLIDKANRVLADYYGEVLPDAVTRSTTTEDLRSKSGALAKDLSFYPTPADVVPLLLVDIPIDDITRVLEPSAGTGSIVRHLLAVKAGRVDAIEVDPGRAAALRLISDKRFTVTQANFLDLHPTPIYGVVAMNPPFFGTHWMEHVIHAFDFLAPGGFLASILPVSAEIGESAKHDEFRKWATERKYAYCNLFRALPAESFSASGTRINTVVLTLRKAA